VALEDEVKDRYGDEHLVNITNPFDEDPTTIDAARLSKAARDVEADFEVYAQVEYDGADARHVSLACEGVVLKLLVRAGELKPKEEADWRKNDLKEGLALVTSRDRILPTSGSELTVPSERTSDEDVYADFDRTRFRRIVPSSPAVGEDDGVLE